jgi:hypothetical protein
MVSWMSWIDDYWKLERIRKQMLKTLFQTFLDQTYSSDLEGVGRLRFEDDGTIYRWVKNEDASNAFVAGDVVCHKIANISTAHQTILQSATANLGMLAGVVMGPLAANTGTTPKIYGWIQVYGYNGTIKMEGTAAIAAGDSLKPVNAQNYAVIATAMGTAPTLPRQIQALEAYAVGAAAAKRGFIRCL